ncbi:MAG: GDP-mannose 4,6-dehydratase [Pyrinomonadaceae bacterium]
MEDPARRFSRIAHLLERITLHAASLESYPSLFHVVSRHQFDECYHLAAQSFVAESFADGFSTMNTNINGTHYLLAALRELRPACKFYFAGTSEMFGKVREMPQREETPFYPRSPYGISKVAGFELTRNYREAYGMFCASGIMFNHESPRRGFEFVTRKVTSGVARIKSGRSKEVLVGNLDAKRDWGHAADFVRAMHLMLQHAEPDDFVVATGETHTVRELCELAFSEAGLDYREFVKRTNALLFRRMDSLIGDATKVRSVLGWRPTYLFQDLIKEMVHADLAAEA